MLSLDYWKGGSHAFRFSFFPFWWPTLTKFHISYHPCTGAGEKVDRQVKLVLLVGVSYGKSVTEGHENYRRPLTVSSPVTPFPQWELF